MATFFFLWFQHLPTTVDVVPLVVEPDKELKKDVSFEDKENIIENQLNHDLDNVEVLGFLKDVRIKTNKVNEAVEVINRIIDFEPSDFE